MTKYLQMDGVDDLLKTPNPMLIQYDKIVIDFEPGVLSNYQYLMWNGSSYYIRNEPNDTERFTVKGFSVDGVNAVSTQTNLIKSNIRINMEVTFTLTNTWINLFGNASTGNFPADVYDIKLFNGTTLVAHYDMSTGTVQDQSGNGNHATLTGGTWVDDGTGGTPTGTDGSISLALTQNIYKDSSANLGLRQEIYQDISSSLDLIQNIYRDTETLLSLNQTIYKDADTALPLIQAIYRDDSVDLTTRQEIYADGQAILNLIQDFYEDSQTFITLQLIQEIYRDESTDLQLNQQIYKDSNINLPLTQQMYEDKQILLPLSQTIYKDDSEILILSQSIYKDTETSLNLAQQMYVDGEISLPLLIQIRDDILTLIGTIRLIGKRVLNVYLQGNRELNIHLKGGIDVTAINQNFSMYAGDTKNIIVPIDDDTLDLTGATVKWGVRKKLYSTTNELTKESPDILVAGNEITIKLLPADTELLTGTYYHECEITDQLGNVSTAFVGMVTINRSAV